MIRISIELDVESLHNIVETEDELINKIEDGFAAANILHESVGAEVIEIDWD